MNTPLSNAAVQIAVAICESVWHGPPLRFMYAINVMLSKVLERSCFLFSIARNDIVVK